MLINVRNTKIEEFIKTGLVLGVGAVLFAAKSLGNIKIYILSGNKLKEKQLESLYKRNYSV